MEVKLTEDSDFLICLLYIEKYYFLIVRTHQSSALRSAAVGRHPRHGLFFSPYDSHIENAIQQSGVLVGLIEYP